MKPPAVSVVMANYNYGRYLPAAIESVLAQSWTNLELLIVDDGSTDNSVEIISRYLSDGRARLIPVPHLGQPGAKNAGIAAASGQFIAFLDADDIWHTDKLAQQLPLFENGSVGVVYSRRTLIDETGSPLPYLQPRLHRGQVLDAMFNDNFVCFSSVVVRRSVFEHIGCFDPHIALAIDFDLWLRAARHYQFDYVDAPLVEYRVGHGNLSRRIGERLKTAMLLMRRFLARGGGEHLSAGAQHAALAATARHMGVALRPYTTSESRRWFFRALHLDPGNRRAWTDLAGSLIPGLARRLVRTILRRPDWEQAYLTPENDPKNG